MSIFVHFQFGKIILRFTLEAIICVRWYHRSKISKYQLKKTSVPSAASSNSSWSTSMVSSAASAVKPKSKDRGKSHGCDATKRMEWSSTTTPGDEGRCLWDSESWNLKSTSHQLINTFTELYLQVPDLTSHPMHINFSQQSHPKPSSILSTPINFLASLPAWLLAHLASDTFLQGFAKLDETRQGRKTPRRPTGLASDHFE